MTTVTFGPSSARGPAVEWRDELDDVLVCAEVHDITHDVRSFVLRPVEPAAFRFLPGQYLTVTVQVDGRAVSRCYTISSSPLVPERLTITVKRVPGGPVSNWLHDRLRPGDLLSVAGPLGCFSTAHHPAGKYLFLSAGSGITPSMSMLRTIHGVAALVDVVVVHHARTPADILFRDELRDLEAEHPGTRVVVVCESDARDERWTGRRGRVDLATILDAAPDVVQRQVFTCGPAPYMAAVRGLLAEVGVEPPRCHEESFDLGLEAAPMVTSGGPVPGPAGGPCVRPSYTVELRRSGRVLDCGADTTVLAAAARAGVTLPSSCQEGMCGTCKTTLLAGRVDMHHAGGIRPREIAQDKILLCCSTPREDLVLDA